MKTAKSVAPTTIKSTVKTDEALLDSVYAEVNKILDTYCQQQISLNLKHDTSKRLWQSLARVVNGGGKRMRPYLVTLSYQACGGKDTSVAYVGAGWEMLHQSLLMHDDIIDRDYIRHGQPNIAGEYQQIYADRSNNQLDIDHYANSAALLAGDTALSSAYQLVFASGFSDSQKVMVAQMMSQAIQTVAGGELEDTDSVMDPIGTTDSLMIAELKTASYSFVGPLQTGAVLAGANDTTVELFGELGIATGVAFQLRDDVLGLFGDIEHTGKSADGDVKEGKRTLLLKYAYEVSTPQQKQLISKIVGNPKASNQQVQVFRDIVIQTGAKKRVEDLIADYANQAQQIVANIPLADKRFTQKWQQFNQFILERNN